MTKEQLQSVSDWFHASPSRIPALRAVNGVCVAIGRGLRFMAEDTDLFRPQFMCLVPAQLQYLLSKGALNPELRHILVGAESAPNELFAAAKARNIAVYYGYGLTEAASGIAMSDGKGDPHALWICPGTEVSISEEGEILVSCGGLMDGYWHDPEGTREKIRDRKKRRRPLFSNRPMSSRTEITT